MIRHFFSICVFTLAVGYATFVLAFSPFAFNQANGNYDIEKFEAAKDIYEKILKDEPENSKAHYNLADAYFRLGEFEKAEEHFLKALNARDAAIREDSLYNLGNTKYRQVKLEESLAYYDKVLEMNPDNEKAALNRAFVKKQIEEKEKEEEKPQPQEPPPSEEQKPEAQEKSVQGNQPGDKESDKPGEEEGGDLPVPDSGEDPNQAKKPEQEKEGDQPKPEEGKADQKEGVAAPQPVYNAGNKPLSKEDAEFWLGSIQDDPKKAAQDIISREVAPGGAAVEKDW